MNLKLLTEEPGYCMFPIVHKDLWAYYKKQEAVQWVVGDIDLSDDNFESLNPNQQHFLKHVLAFFAASDGIVNENLVVNFSNEVKYSEARAFYAAQIYNETVHSETYSLLIDTYIKDEDEKERLFNAIHTLDSVKKKADWAIKYIDSDNFLERLIAFICVEGIFFSGSFCAIYWMQDRGLPLPGLTKANEWISRDESTHCDFAIDLYLNHVEEEYKLSKDVIRDIVVSAVDIELEFIRESLPVSLVGIDSDKMSDYIKYVADDILVRLGLEKEYNTKQPFTFMYKIALDKKTNFFERKVGEYVKPTGEISFDNDDF